MLQGFHIPFAIAAALARLSALESSPLLIYRTLLSKFQDLIPFDVLLTPLLQRWFLFWLFWMLPLVSFPDFLPGKSAPASGRDKIPAPICVHNGKSLLVNLHLDRTGQSAQAVGQQLGPIMKTICRRRNRSCCFYLGSRGTSAGNNLGRRPCPVLSAG